jgi:DNA-binding PadR family transcriptional regulator
MGAYGRNTIFGGEKVQTVSNKEAALLGLLHEEPMHPYQIEKTIQFRDMRSWTEISMSSIYKTLSSLEKRNLVKSDVKISQQNRPQKTFRLTSKGRKAIRDKVRELLARPETVIWQFDLGNYFMDVLEDGEIVGALDEYEKGLREMVVGYGELEKYMREEDCPEWRIAVATRTKCLLEAEIEWLKKYRKNLGL